MGEIPFNVVCLSGQLHDPESVYQYPKWLGNAAALSTEFRHCWIHGDRKLVTTYVRACQPRQLLLSMFVQVSHDVCSCKLVTAYVRAS